MRALSAREHLLLIGALAFAVVFALYGLRYRPHAARLREWAGHKALVQNQLASAKWPVDPGDPGRLTRERDRLRAEVECLRADLAREETRFVSQSSPAAMDELRVRISELADRHRLHLRENRSCREQELRGFIGKTQSEAAALVRFLTLGEPYSFRARHLAFETDFAGLRGFLRDLAALDQRVVVLRIEIAVAEPRRTEATPLEIRMVLVL